MPLQWVGLPYAQSSQAVSPRGVVVEDRVHFPSVGVGTAHLAYETTTNSWLSCAPSPLASDGGVGSYAASWDGMLYHYGTAVIDVPSSPLYSYDFVTDSWTRLADLPFQMWEGPSAASDGVLYAMGGQHFVHYGPFTTTRCFAYTIATGSWAEIASQPAVHCNGGAAASLNGKIYCAGGLNSTIIVFGPSYNRNIDIYDIATDSWSQVVNGGVYAGRAPLVWDADQVLWSSGYDARLAVQHLADRGEVNLLPAYRVGSQAVFSVPSDTLPQINQSPDAAIVSPGAFDSSWVAALVGTDLWMFTTSSQYVGLQPWRLESVGEWAVGRVRMGP